MGSSKRLSIVLKAARQLGLARVANYGLYQVQLRSGYFAWRVRDGRCATNLPPDSFRLHPLLRIPSTAELMSVLGEEEKSSLLEGADEITAGFVRLFGGEPLPLELGAARSEMHWTELERAGNSDDYKDVKWVWEAGRFGWAYILGRAYRISSDERYPKAFWNYFDEFIEANPPYYGFHWTSAQEVAIRLIALVFAAQVFASSRHSTQQHVLSLGRAIAAHAARIPLSLSYARAQDNNHLLVEATGLYTAGIVLPEHPQANRWRELGWGWANQALQNQIAENGTYIQHSTNYHRLMLQTALWLHSLAHGYGVVLPTPTQHRLRAATQWLFELLDVATGRVPNLGPNDGAYILPLSVCPYWDYRPVLQAAVGVFWGGQIFDHGPWDEMALWLGVPGADHGKIDDPNLLEASEYRFEPKYLHVMKAKETWAYFRAARFTSRPGHADQLHVDLWWRGFNIALDAGTYLYNDSPPWDNTLSSSLVHNTVTVNGRDQMVRAGRFLWLDWAQSTGVSKNTDKDGRWQQAVSEHDGYRQLGLSHRRKLTAYDDNRWLVEDNLYRVGLEPGTHNAPYTIRLHWLLLDCPWELSQDDDFAIVKLESPLGFVSLRVNWVVSQLTDSPASIQLIRAGELIYGTGAVSPVSGWYSPTYGYKVPALSFSVTAPSSLPMKYTSEWQFSS